MKRFNWTYPDWVDETYQVRFEERAALILAAKPDGDYRVYLPYYQYAWGDQVKSAPHEVYNKPQWTPIVVVLKWNELTIGRCAIQVGKATVSHRHACPRCGHSILDHSTPRFVGSLAVAEWSKCICDCTFYVEEVFAPYDH